MEVKRRSNEKKSKYINKLILSEYIILKLLENKIYEK